MFENIKAVIFDMDGTLIDSMWLWREIDIEYLNRHQLALPETLQKEIEGKSFSETAQYFKERFKINDDVETIKTEWNTMATLYYQSRVTIKPYAMELIRHLKELGIKIGIGTSNSKELLSVILDRFELKDHVDSIRTSCEVEKGKPHPDIFLKVCEDFALMPTECLVFEDVPNGIMAAKNAGMRCIAIHDDFSKTMEEEKRSMADAFIYSFDEAIGWLKKVKEIHE